MSHIPISKTGQPLPPAWSATSRPCFNIARRKAWVCYAGSFFLAGLLALMPFPGALAGVQHPAARILLGGLVAGPMCWAFAAPAMCAFVLPRLLENEGMAMPRRRDAFWAFCGCVCVCTLPELAVALAAYEIGNVAGVHGFFFAIIFFSQLIIGFLALLSGSLAFFPAWFMGLRIYRSAAQEPGMAHTIARNMILLMLPGLALVAAGAIHPGAWGRWLRVIALLLSPAVFAWASVIMAVTVAGARAQTGAAPGQKNWIWRRAHVVNISIAGAALVLLCQCVIYGIQRLF